MKRKIGWKKSEDAKSARGRPLKAIKKHNLFEGKERDSFGRGCETGLGSSMSGGGWKGGLSLPKEWAHWGEGKKEFKFSVDHPKNGRQKEGCKRISGGEKSGKQRAIFMEDYCAKKRKWENLVSDL